MLEFHCPNNNLSEREYIILLLFEEFLGCKCIIKFQGESDSYLILYGNYKIYIEDHFFNRFQSDLSYLDNKNIPESYSLLTSYDLPIIYGRNYIDFSKTEIHCGLDIFASCFFLLTRWEEFVLPKIKDGLKCDEGQLFVVRNNLTIRPLVNEYLDFIIHLFSHFGLNIQPKRDYSVFQTHDVDWVYLSTFSELCNNLKRKIFQQRIYKQSLLLLFRYLYYKVTFTNPFNSFNSFMDFSDSLGLKNSFYFKACVPGENGFTYKYNDPRVISVVNNIKNRGHEIGFHPSENTFQNELQFRTEYYRLLEVLPAIKGGRQHHLLYHAGSFSTWDKFDLGYDSGCGFQYRNGFRCGTCYDFPLFDVFSRKKLRLREVPFAILDSVFVRKQASIQEMEKESKEIIDVVKRYNGILCTVWHTNLFQTIERKKFQEVYYRIIKYAVS